MRVSRVRAAKCLSTRRRHGTPCRILYQRNLQTFAEVSQLALKFTWIRVSALMNQSLESGSIPWVYFLLPHTPHHAVVVTVALLALALRHSGQATPARALCAPVSQSIVDARDRD